MAATANDWLAQTASRAPRPNYEEGCRCPACGRQNWLIGRTSAECGFCGTALALAPAVYEPAPIPAPRRGFLSLFRFRRGAPLAAPDPAGAGVLAPAGTLPSEARRG